MIEAKKRRRDQDSDRGDGSTGPGPNAHELEPHGSPSILGFMKGVGFKSFSSH